MSERLGMVNVSSREEHILLGRDLLKPREVSEQTAREIDEEVRRIIDGCYNRARQIILDQKDKLVALAEVLIEYETLDASEIEELVETGKLSKPPRSTPSTVTPPSSHGIKPELVSTPVINPGPAPANT
jgi:cell division protease FtsH